MWGSRTIFSFHCYVSRDVLLFSIEGCPAAFLLSSFVLSFLQISVSSRTTLITLDVLAVKLERNSVYSAAHLPFLSPWQRRPVFRMRVWVASLVFYAFVFAACEFLRYLIVRLMPKRLSTDLLLEVISGTVHYATESNKKRFRSVCWHSSNMHPDVRRGHRSRALRPVRSLRRN